MSVSVAAERASVANNTASAQSTSRRWIGKMKIRCRPLRSAPDFSASAKDGISVKLFCRCCFAGLCFYLCFYLCFHFRFCLSLCTGIVFRWLSGVRFFLGTGCRSFSGSGRRGWRSSVGRCRRCGSHAGGCCSCRCGFYCAGGRRCLAGGCTGGRARCGAGGSGCFGRCRSAGGGLCEGCTHSESSSNNGGDELVHNESCS